MFFITYVFVFTPLSELLFVIEQASPRAVDIFLGGAAFEFAHGQYSLRTAGYC